MLLNESVTIYNNVRVIICSNEVINNQFYEQQTGLGGSRDRGVHVLLKEVHR